VYGTPIKLQAIKIVMRHMAVLLTVESGKAHALHTGIRIDQIIHHSCAAVYLINDSTYINTVP